MVTGDNEGHAYEKKIKEILRKKKIKITLHDAGSGGKTDLKFLHAGKEYSLEIKNNVRDPDYGQCGVEPKYVSGKWIWDWTESSKKKSPDMIEYYNKFVCVDGTKGVLEYLNKKNIIPNKYRIADEDLTLEDRQQDMDNFEDTENRLSIDAFDKFYQTKSDYIQVGQKNGFYHIKKDVANLETEKFDANFFLRFRAKAYFTHYPKCPKCNTRYRPGVKNCRKCGVEIKRNKSRSECPVCKASEEHYEHFEHVNFDYSFKVVIKCDRINVRSKFNIEENKDQKFPPIIS